MIQFEHRGMTLCDGLSRRTWLQLGALGAMQWGTGSLVAGDAAKPEASAGRKAKAKSCVQLFLWGGPGAQETWDPKPAAPLENRGEFRPIATSIPGFQICEHLPKLAARADRYTIVRSQTHTGVNHGTSSYHMLTGHIHWSPGTLRHPTKSDIPNLGCNAGRFLPHPDYLPAHVHLPAIINDGDGLPVPGQDAGFLGDSQMPFRVLGDLTQPGFRVPALELAQGLSRERLARRAGLREAIDSRLEYLGKNDSGKAVDASYERATSLLASPETERAFDLSREPAEMRERYGKHHFAQALLLARRLVEAGVPYITVYWNSPSLTFFQIRPRKSFAVALKQRHEHSPELRWPSGTCPKASAAAEGTADARAGRADSCGSPGSRCLAVRRQPRSGGILSGHAGGRGRPWSGRG